MEYLKEILCFLVLFLMTIQLVTTNSVTADISKKDCGKFINVKKGNTGSVISPDYPSNYPNKALCIWLLQAPIDWKFEMTIESMDGESSGGNCTDYLEVRSGASDQRIDYFECESDTSQTFNSKSRWLWMKFKSGASRTNTGFSANYSLVRDKGNEEDATPVKACRPNGRGITLECDNKECVPWAYVCDKENDCGCTGKGCDEDPGICTGLGLSKGALVGIGVTVGFVVFIPTFFGIGLLDIYMKKKAEKDLEVKIKEAKQRERQKKIGGMLTGAGGGGGVPQGAPSRPATASAKKNK